MRSTGQLAVLALAVGAAVAAAKDPASTAPTAAPLRLGQAVQLPAGLRPFVPLARCDSAGNVLFVAVSESDARAVAGSRRAPRRLANPVRVRRISADRKKLTLFEVGEIAPFSDATEIDTFATGVDPNDGLHVLVLARKNRELRQYVVSFAPSGEYEGIVEVPSDKMRVSNTFQVFGGGEYLIEGSPPGTRATKFAILSPSGGLRRLALPGPEGEPDPDWLAFVPHDFELGGDGRLYYVQEGKTPRLRAVSRSGEVSDVLELTRPAGDMHVSTLRVSGQRVAITYNERRAGGGEPRWWIAVYDLARRSRAAWYGPVQQPPVCYAAPDGRDRFTLVRGNELVTAVP